MQTVLFLLNWDNTTRQLYSLVTLEFHFFGHIREEDEKTFLQIWTLFSVDHTQLKCENMNLSNYEPNNAPFCIFIQKLSSAEARSEKVRRQLKLRRAEVQKYVFFQPRVHK